MYFNFAENFSSVVKQLKSPLSVKKYPISIEVLFQKIVNVITNGLRRCITNV